MEHTTYLTALAVESARFHVALDRADPGACVPGCDWTAADLRWHLADVQHFWAEVAGGADGAVVPEPVRPEPAALAAAGRAASAELAAALAGRDPSTPAWSWHPDGGSLEWVARRQAHEALIHRVDAEQAAGLAVSLADPVLAADGVDEVLRVLLAAVAGPGDFAPDGLTIRLTCTDTSGDWVLATGRFHPAGTEPTGTDAVAVLDEDEGGDDTVVVSGPAWALDTWLWGRTGLAGLVVTGERSLLDRLRAVVVEATQ